MRRVVHRWRLVGPRRGLRAETITASPPPRLLALSKAPFSAVHPTSRATRTQNARSVNEVNVGSVESASAVEVVWPDGHTSQYDYTWLRVNCPSSMHESGQSTLFPGDVRADLKPLEVSAVESAVAVAWPDGHVSVYRLDWLRAHDCSPSVLHARTHRSRTTPLFTWDAIPRVDGREYMETDEALYAALRKINRAGVVLLENVGVEENTVLDLARRVAPISHNALYGEIFDVISQGNPRNLAYTQEGLRFHMDLAYYESPPGLQLLHCLEFGSEVKGGESTFLDAFAAAEHFRDNFPDKFEVLCRVPTTFQKVRAAAPHVEGEDRNLAALTEAHMTYQRPIFQVDANGELLAVTWAPMFEGVQMCAVKDMPLYLSAHAEFLRLIEEGHFAESHTVRERLEPGQCLVFNNRRMLHGRRGCYVNADDALSRLCSLHVGRSSADPDSDPDYLTRVGNGSLPLA